MKRATLLFAIFAALSTVTFAQAEKRIASIRTEVNLINKGAPKYTKATRDVEGVSLEGAQATYFTSGRGLKKIAAKMYGETFRATAELYYAGEELIFAFQRLEKYNTHVAANPPPKVVKVMETRVYYTGAKAVRVIEGKRLLASSDSEFRAAEEGMTDLSEKLKAAMADQ